MLSILQIKKLNGKAELSDRELKYSSYIIARIDNNKVIIGVTDKVGIKSIKELYERKIKFNNATIVKKQDNQLIARGLNCNIPNAVYKNSKIGDVNYGQRKKSNNTGSNPCTGKYRIDRGENTRSIQSLGGDNLQEVQVRRDELRRSNQGTGVLSQKGSRCRQGSELDRASNLEYTLQPQDNRTYNGDASRSNWVGRTLKTDKDFETFVQAFDKAKKANKFGCCVDSHSTQELKGMKVVKLYNGGNAGVAVENSGNIVSVFKHPDCKIKGFGTFAIEEAIKCGGDRLDCYNVNGQLPDTYMKAGMVPVCRIKFNAEYKPADWNEEAGEPDVVFMIKNNGILPQKSKYNKYTADEVPYIYDTAEKCAYDLAAEYADNKLKEIARIKKDRENAEAAKRLKESKGNLMKAFRRNK